MWENSAIFLSAERFYSCRTFLFDSLAPRVYRHGTAPCIIAFCKVQVRQGHFRGPMPLICITGLDITWHIVHCIVAIIMDRVFVRNILEWWEKWHTADSRTTDAIFCHKLSTLWQVQRVSHFTGHFDNLTLGKSTQRQICCSKKKFVLSC